MILTRKMKTIKALGSFLLFFTILSLYRLTACADIAAGNCGPNLAYRISDDGVLTISGKGTMYGYSTQGPWGNKATSLIVEEGVSCITEKAFKNCTNLTSITIADGVHIYAYAFQGCTGLTSVEIPYGVDIDHNVFSDCTGLTTATLFKMEIPKGTFAGCTSLKTVIMPNAQTICDGAFSDCISLTDIIIPSSVSFIGDYAFSGCRGLTSVIIPENVTQIGGYAFSGCSKLITAGAIGSGSNIEFGWKEVIPYRAFYGATSLESIVLPEGITTLDRQSFAACNLTSITIPESVKNISYSAFEGTDGLKTAGPIGGDYNYKFGWTREIPAYAFYHMSRLSNVTIPDGIISIGYKAFEDCSGLTSIKLPKTVVSFSYDAFSGCSFKTAGPAEGEYDYSFEWTNYIPPYAFHDLSSLTKVVIPDGITSIDQGAFNGCTGLIDITIPRSVTSIFYNSFSYCNGLETAGPIGGDYNYKFGWTQAIPSYAFSGIENLKNVMLPKGINTIEYCAFQGCNSIKSIGIPYGVSKIDFSAFSGCTSLETIRLPYSITDFGTDVFKYCVNMTAVIDSNSYALEYAINNNIPYVIKEQNAVSFGPPDLVLPKALSIISEEAFCGISASCIEITGNVRRIEKAAFAECDNLKQVFIPSSVDYISTSAFNGTTDLVIYGVAGSYAEDYAYDYGFSFIEMQ